MDIDSIKDSSFRYSFALEELMMNNTNSQNTSVYRNYTPTYNNTPPYVKPKVVEDPAVLEKKKKMAKKLGLASLIYAIFSTFCLYRNLSGVTMPLFGIATLVYMIYGLKQYDVKIKKTSWFYGSVLLALTISNFLTGNPTILFFNNVGIFLMLFVFLLHNVYDDSRWNFSKTAMSICESVFCSIGALDDFSKDMKVLKQRNTFGSYYSSKKATIKYVLIGLIISIPVVSIILLLLLNADAVFNKFLSTYVLEGYLKIIYNFGDTIGVTITFAIIFFAAY